MTKALKGLILIMALVVIASAVFGTKTKGLNPSWSDVAEGISYYNEEGMHIYKFDQEMYGVELLNDSDEPKYMSEWATEISGEIMVVNGFFFHPDYSPSGNLVINDEMVGERDFGDAESALLRVERSGTYVIDTADAQLMSIPVDTDKIGLESSAQSFPLLLRKGERAVKEDSGLVARRSFVGTSEEYLYLGVVDARRVSLYELADELEELELEWQHVLNLDGGPSSGLWVNISEHKNHINNQSRVPSVIVVKSRKGS